MNHKIIDRACMTECLYKSSAIHNCIVRLCPSRHGHTAGALNVKRGFSTHDILTSFLRVSPNHLCRREWKVKNHHTIEGEATLISIPQFFHVLRLMESSTEKEEGNFCKHYWNCSTLIHKSLCVCVCVVVAQ